MHETFGAVREMEFKEKPEYDALARIVSSLKVHVNASSSSSRPKAAKSKATASGKVSTGSPSTKRKSHSSRTEYSVSGRTSSKTSAKRTNRSSPESSPSPQYDEDVPPGSSKLSSRAARAAARNAAKTSETGSNKVESEVGSDSDSDVVMVDVSDVESERNSVDLLKESDDEMDWEQVTDENEPSASNKPVTKESEGPSLTLECTDGPHRGESFELTGTLVIGSDPKKEKGLVKVSSVRSPGRR